MDATRIASLHYPELRRAAKRQAEDWRRVDALRRLLRRHLPPVTASLFARAQPLPSPPDRIDWYSDLAGEPVALDELPDQARDRTLALISDRLQSARRLADQLDAASLDEEDADAVSLLRRATCYPHPGCVYLVAGEPVLTYWGLEPPVPPGDGRGPRAEPLPRRSLWHRKHPFARAIAALGLAAVMVAIGIAGWHLWEERLRDRLQDDLVAGLAANCEPTAVLEALKARLDRIDPGATRFPELHLDTERELDRCADAAELAADFAAARDDCALLSSVSEALLYRDVERPPLAQLKASVDQQVADCAFAKELTEELAALRGNCEGIVALARVHRERAADGYPLAEPLAEIAAEAAACGLADELEPLLGAANGDCGRLREVDRSFRQRLAVAAMDAEPASPMTSGQSARSGSAVGRLDGSRAPLASLRNRLDEELQRCALVDHLAERLAAAQGDCVELASLAETLARQGDSGPPFDGLALQIDGALSQCAVLTELEQRFVDVQGDCAALAAFRPELERWRDNLRFADIRARVADEAAICDQADELERQIAAAKPDCQALRGLQARVADHPGPQFRRARATLRQEIANCDTRQRYVKRLADAGSHCGRLKKLQRDLKGESGGYLKSVRQRLAKALIPCRPKPKVAKPPSGSGAYALRGNCNGSLTISPAGGYHRDRVRHIVRISPPANARVAKVVSDNRGCRNCRLTRRNATTWSVGLFYNCSGRGPVPISYSAYDGSGRLICSGKGVANCLGRRR